MSLENYSDQTLVAICSNLAKACEKQTRSEQASLLKEVESFFQKRVKVDEKKELTSMIEDDLTDGYEKVWNLGEKQEERGALRCVTWGKKVTAIQKSVLSRYEKQGASLLEGNNLFVCDACGFIAIGKDFPVVCPICKAPTSRFVKY